MLEPAGTEGAPGVTAIDTNAGAVTVRVVEPLMVPEVAVMVVEPCARLLARPALFTVAVDVDEDVQVATVVRFCVLPLL